MMESTPERGAQNEVSSGVYGPPGSTVMDDLDDEPGCWGSFIKADHGNSCDPNFVRGRRHMKNKFCWYCTDGDLHVEASRVRGMPECLFDSVINSCKGGVWSTCEEVFGTQDRFRVVNNTAGCRAPRLIIFEQRVPTPPNGADWIPMPPEWATNGIMYLAVSRGTLIPTKPPAGPRKHQRHDLRSDGLHHDLRGEIYRGRASVPAPMYAGAATVCAPSGMHAAPSGASCVWQTPASSGHVPVGATLQPHYVCVMPPSMHPPEPPSSSMPGQMAYVQPNPYDSAASAAAAAAAQHRTQRPSQPPPAWGGPYDYHQNSAQPQAIVQHPPKPEYASWPPQPPPHGQPHAQPPQPFQSAAAPPPQRAPPHAPPHQLHPQPHAIKPEHPHHQQAPQARSAQGQPPKPPGGGAGLLGQLGALAEAAACLGSMDDAASAPADIGDHAPAPPPPADHVTHEERNVNDHGAEGAFPPGDGSGTGKRSAPQSAWELRPEKREKKVQPTEAMLLAQFQKLQMRLTRRAERGGEDASSDAGSSSGKSVAFQLSIVEKLCGLIEDADADKLERVDAALADLAESTTEAYSTDGGASDRGEAAAIHAAAMRARG